MTAIVMMRLIATGTFGACFAIIAVAAIGSNPEGWIVAGIGSFCFGVLNQAFRP